MKTKIKILHLEANTADAALVERELAKGNIQFEIWVVAHKIAFENALKAFTPDLILCEHNIRAIDCFDTINIIKQKGLKIPIILVTDKLSDKQASEILKAGAQDYFLKDRLQRLPYAIVNAIEKHNTEQKLSESENFNKAVLSSLSLHIVVIAQNGTILAANKAWDLDGAEDGIASLHSVSTGSNYFEVCKQAIKSGDENTVRVLAGIQSVFENTKHYFEMEYSCKTGNQQLWFLLSVAYLEGHNQQVVISHQNITQRKIAENELITTSVEWQQSLSQLEKILNSSLDVICTVNANWEFVNVSEASKTVWGYTPEELIGTKFINLVYHEDRDMTTKAAEIFFKGMQLPLFENRYVHKTGKIVTILWSVNLDVQLGLMYCVAKDVTEKKGLEKAMETERNQFYDMFLKAPSAIGMLKGENYVFEMANPLYLQLSGKIDIIGKTLAEVFPELVEQGILSLLDQVYQTGESLTGTEVLVKVDTKGNGELTEIYINFVYQAYRNGQGKIKGIFFFINNVTEKILSQKKLEKSEKLFKGMIENSDDLITIIDANGDPMYASPAVAKKFGYTPEEVMNLNIMDVMHPEDIPVAGAFLSELMRHPAIAMNAPLIRERKKDGTYIWIEGTLTNFLETDGINAIVANFRDITERKTADEENRFKANLLNTIGQAAIATDLNGIVDYWNQAAEHIYGWTKEEALGIHIMDLTTSETTIEQANQIMEALQKGETWSGEFKVRRKDGTNFTALITNSPTYNENGELSGIIGISSDVTEMKKLEDLLEKTNALAAIGSWEVDMVNGTVFWSDITKEIHEADKDYVPQLDMGISYFKDGIYKDTIKQKVQECIENGSPWDEELEITTFKGNQKWVRSIGEGEYVNGKCIGIRGSFQDIDIFKNAEAKIKESEIRYRQIVETAQEGIWTFNENNETTFVNQKMSEIIGYSFDEMIGKKTSFFKDSNGFQPAKNSLEKRRRQGISETYKASFVTKDGKMIWTQISSNSIFDDAKKYKGSLWMVSDITEKLMADKMLLESEQKYRKLSSELEIERTRLVTAQAVAKVGSWETDLQTFQVNWSAETHRIFGSDPENFEASHAQFLDFIHPTDREKVEAAFRNSFYKSSFNSIEHRIITLQGVEKWVEENWSVTKDEHGAPEVAVGTCQDITESKKAQEKVQRSETKLKFAQRIARVGSWEADLSTNEHSWSDEFYRILGINEDVKPSSEAFMLFVHPEDRSMASRAMEFAFSKYKDSSYEFRFFRKNGEIGYASSEWKFEFESHDNSLHIRGILRDLTIEKKAERERIKMISDIVQRNSDLEQFSYIVSHNLRAPTANIIGFADILQDDSISAQEQKELLHGLSASVNGLDTIIKDINTILQSKREVYEKKEIVIFSKLVNDIVISIGHLIEKYQVKVACDFSEVDEIYSLKVYIYSIFYNLISNSIKYSKPNEQPLIEIKSKKENSKVILTFKDNGLGIDIKNKADKIFGLYNRFHSHVEGKGMGLFMVKTQVESLGGKIAVISELNKGTEFTITFEI